MEACRGSGGQRRPGKGTARLRGAWGAPACVAPATAQRRLGAHSGALVSGRVTAHTRVRWRCEQSAATVEACIMYQLVLQTFRREIASIERVFKFLEQKAWGDNARFRAEHRGDLE
jgi:hypothetical protein